MKVVDREALDRLSEEAKGRPRRRKNLDFHGDLEEPCHRLLNAVEPGSFVRPHRYLGANKDETLVAVRGRVALVTFDEAGEVTGIAELAPEGPAFAVNVPRGELHVLVALEPGSVVFEAKAGPYRPLTAEEVPAWAPEEGSAEAAAWLAALERRVKG